MRISMAGLDYKTAGVEIRERFSLTTAGVQEMLERLQRVPGVEGCVLLSTCNRTELYLSHRPGYEPDGVQAFCEALGLDAQAYRPYFRVRSERKAVMHLMMVSSGLRSQILGEDQILTQVKKAIETARSIGSSDAALETLFRLAVTGGKKVKTNISFAGTGTSVVRKSLDRLQEAAGKLAGKRILVIGNGETGRLAAAHLRQAGSEVFMTVRSYHSGAAHAPEGCTEVPYDQRYELLTEVEAVLSATTSPHHTVELEKVGAQGGNMPRYFLDLAVPRDIDPAIGELPGVTLWNVDDLGGLDFSEDIADQFREAKETLEEQAARFEAWRQQRAGLQEQRQYPRFPLFLDIAGKKVTVVGGGQVALRRVRTLLEFGAEILVVSPRVCAPLEVLHHEGRIEWTPVQYEPEQLQGSVIAVAATDSRLVNRQVGGDATAQGIPVSVADSREECTFWFPAVVHSDDMVTGLVSVSGDHARVRETAAMLRERLGTRKK